MRPPVHRRRAALLVTVGLCCVSGLVAVAASYATLGNAVASDHAENTAASDPGLPIEGRIHFGEEFAGVKVGMPAAEVDAAWGTDYGSCRDCSNPTRYYTYAPFTSVGAGVEFVAGRVEAAFTLWQPAGWRSKGGLTLGTPREEIPDAYLELEVVDCGGYEVFVHVRDDTKTALYMYEDALWAYGLMTTTRPVCR
jgi:hypothetical protein